MTEAILNMETNYLSSLRLQARLFYAVLPFVGAVLAVGCTIERGKIREIRVQTCLSLLSSW